MTAIASPAAALSEEPKNGKYQRYLHTRGGVFYFKGTYPKDVHEKVPGKSIQKWKSLGTHDYIVAQTKLALEIQVFEGDVARMRAARLPGPMRSLPAQVHAPVVRSHFFEGQIPQLELCLAYDLMKADDEFRRATPAVEVASALEQKRILLKSIEDGIYQHDFSVVSAQLDDMLRREKMTLPPNTQLRSRVEEAFARKYAEVLAVIVDRRTNRATTPRVPIRLREMLTLLDLHHDWSKTARSNGKLRKRRTRQTYLGYVSEFAAMFGAVPVAAITDVMCDEYLARLVASGLERRSIENHVGGLRALVKFEVSKKKDARLFDNPFARVSFDGIEAKPDHESRREFEPEELKLLFGSKVYTHGYRPRGQVGESAFWAPLIALYMGLRVEEIAQLGVRDVACRNGVWVLRVCEFDETQGVKSEESKRDVPIHDELHRCGLLAYAADVKLAGQRQLFPTLKCDNENQLYSNALTKWFSRAIDSIGIDDPNVCFHSFRMNFSQAVADALPQGGEEVRCALMGHWYSKRRDPGKHYVAQRGGKYPILALAKTMKQVRFDGLDLSGLYVDEPFRNVEKAFGMAPPKGL